MSQDLHSTDVKDDGSRISGLLTIGRSAFENDPYWRAVFTITEGSDLPPVKSFSVTGTSMGDAVVTLGLMIRRANQRRSEAPLNE